MLNQLNFHHLFYFWTVATEGSIQGAAAKLRLAHPTISSQIKLLEGQLGHKLLRRHGRGVVLTEEGELVFQYAGDIVASGNELLAAMAQDAPLRPSKVVVGVTEGMPKLIVRKLLDPALQVSENVHLVLEEDRVDRLLAQLAIHQLDLVLSDVPVPDSVDVKAFNHRLGECGLSFLATRALRKQLKGKFPQNLDGAPMLLPTPRSAVRRSLDAYFRSEGIRPKIVAEVADSAMLKVLGSDGLGVFPVASVIEASAKEQFSVVSVGRTDAIREAFYVISTERRVRNPAVLAICTTARTEIFDAFKTDP